MVSNDAVLRPDARVDVGEDGVVAGVIGTTADVVDTAGGADEAADGVRLHVLERVALHAPDERQLADVGIWSAGTRSAMPP